MDPEDRSRRDALGQDAHEAVAASILAWMSGAELIERLHRDALTVEHEGRRRLDPRPERLRGPRLDGAPDRGIVEARRERVGFEPDPARPWPPGGRG